MSKKCDGAAMDFSFPTPEERQAAMCVCCGSHCPGCESPDDYAWRRRDVDLSILTDDVIKTRLTQREREAVESYWFDGMTVSGIAARSGVCPSSVSRCLEKAQRKIYDALKYAVAYQHNIETVDFLPVAVRRALAVSAAKRFEAATLGERVKKLRCSENIGAQMLCEALGISPRVLRDIESGEKEPGLRLLTQLAGFFGVTADYLLKGEE
ncbi:MAG: helix-turn-helix domain-containing protein [Acutalibacteraceae bacterium]